MQLKTSLVEAGATCKVIAPKQGFISSDNGELVKVDESFLITSSVLYDAVFVADHSNINMLAGCTDAVYFVAEAFKHCKAIGATEGSASLLQMVLPEAALQSAGIITNGNEQVFMDAVAQHRFWEREEMPVVAA